MRKGHTTPNILWFDNPRTVQVQRATNWAVDKALINQVRIESSIKVTMTRPPAVAGSTIAAK